MHARRTVPLSLFRPTLFAFVLAAAFAGAASAAGKPPAGELRLHGVLAELGRQQAVSAKKAGDFAKSRGLDVNAGGVLVTVEAAERNGAGRIDFDALAASGIELIRRSRNYASVRVPVEELPALAAAEGVGLVRPPLKATGLVTSQGVAKTGAADYHAAGYDGSGVKVAVIDLGFSTLDSAVAHSELVYAGSHDCTGSGLTTGIVHGTGVAETVYDMAPGAEIYLLKVSGSPGLEEAVDSCIAWGVDVINHSVGWFGLPGDGTGSICEIADDAHDAGILWVNSAGNHANNHSEATFSDTDADSLHNFAPGVNYIPISASSGTDIYLFLTWNAAWPDSQDYDLYLYDNSYTPVASATSKGTQYPSEYVLYTATYTGTYYAAVKKYHATSDHDFDLMLVDHSFTSYGVKGGSLLSPADGFDVLAVGAIYHGNWTTGPTESFSSQGPTNDGRVKPDVCGPDGGSNYTYNLYTGSPFYGTSASSPHVAGAAALLLDEHPAWTADSVAAALKATAVDMGSAGADSVYGYGRIELDTSGAGGGGGAIGPVTSFTATGDHGKVDLAWTNPSDTLFESTVIRYSTGGYPADESSGSSVGLFPGAPGSSDSNAHTGLANGTTYYYSAFAYDGSDYSTAATASATPQDTTPPLPDPVVSFTASPRDTAVFLAWTNPAAAGFVSTTVRYSTSSFPSDAGGGTAVENGAGGVFAGSPGAADSFLHEGLTNGVTYYYSAFAYDGSDYSDRALDSATPADTTAPAQVRTFVATADEGEVKLVWANPWDADFVKTEIRFSTDTWPIGTGAGAHLGYFAGAPGSDDSTTHSGLGNGTTYYYSAFTCDAVGNTSPPYHADATPEDVTPTGPVTSFAATGGDGEIELSWTNPADADFDHTAIRYSTGGYPAGPGAGNDVGTFSGSPGSHGAATHSGLTNGVTYYYAAYAYDGENNDAAAAQANAVPADTTAPAAVTLFTATPGDGEITLAWTNPADADFDFTRIRWSNDNWPATPESANSLGDFSDNPGSGSSTVHTGLTNGLTYYYAAFAADGDANFASADSASAVPADTTVPAPVSGFGAAKGDGEVLLGWTNPGDADFAKTVVRYSTAGYPAAPESGLAVGTFTDPAGAEVQFAHTGLANGTAYYYAAFAVDDEENASPAAHATATPADTTAPAEIGDFVAAPLDGAVDLSWTNPPDSDFMHTVIRWSPAGYPQDPDGGEALALSSGGAGASESYRHEGLTNGDTAYYSAFAFDSSGNRADPAEADAVPRDTTAPAGVSAFAAAAGDTTVYLSWVNPADADFDHVLIRYSTASYLTGPTDGALVDSISGAPGESEGAVHGNLPNGVTHYYAAFAGDEAGNYSERAIASALPADTTAPAPAAGFAAIAGTERITLGWTDPPDADFEYRELRFSLTTPPSTPGEGTRLALSAGEPGAAGSFVHDSLTAGITYYYTLFSYDEAHNRSSVSASAVPLPPPAFVDTTGPDPVTQFAAEPREGAVFVRWTNPANADLAGIDIRFSSDGFPATPGGGDDLFDGSKGAWQAVPGAADSLLHTGLVNGQLYYYSAFVYDTLENYSAAAHDSARPKDLTAPLLTLGLFQNPLLTREVDLYLIGSEPLDGGSISITAGPMELDALLNDPDEDVWRADWRLPGAGIFPIAAEGADLAGNNASVSSSLSVSLVPAGSAVVAGSPDGSFRATVPPGAFPRETWLLVIPSGSGGSAAAKRSGAAGMAELGPPVAGYTISPARPLPAGVTARIEWRIDAASIAPLRMDDVGLAAEDGTPLACYVDPAAATLYAAVDRMGGFHLARAAGGSALPVDPRRTALGGNRPNPFNPVTQIPFTLGAPGRVTLTVHALSGRLVRVLLRETLPPGDHVAAWDGRDSRGRPLGSGFYLYRLDTMAGSESRKMLLVR